MDYLHPKTLEFLMYILFEGDLMEEPPYEFSTKVFGSDMNYIFDELERYRIDDCFEIGDTATYFSRSGEPKEFNGITLTPHNKPEVEKFINNYIDEFKEGKLQSPQNYYSFEKHLPIIINSILEPYYKKSGKNFAIDYNFEDASFACAKEIVRKNFLLYETLLYLNKEGFIKINKGFKCVELKEHSESVDEVKKYVLSINITLKQKPIEISRFFFQKLRYGDIEINVDTGESYYKENKYHFNSEGTTFKLLCHLVKNSEKELSIIDVYNILAINVPNISDCEKKERITHLIKDIRKKLNIQKSQNPTIEITIRNGRVKLT